MTPSQKIKHLILIHDAKLGGDPLNDSIDQNMIDDVYEERYENYHLSDSESEIREGEVETGVKCEYSRHYESKAVAARYIDGSWVGWTYWYGGGKHSEPEAMEWIEHAYDLDCKEEEKLVIVRTFSIPK